MRRDLRWLIRTAAIAAFVLQMPAALADTQTFNSIFFQPATGKNPYLMLHGTETLHKLQFDGGLVFSYAYHPFEISQSGTRLRGIIDQMLVTDFVAAVGATEWLQFGIDFPLILVNKFAAPLTAGSPPTKNYVNVGDIRMEAVARVFDQCDKPVGLAFIPFITVPTGSSTHYVGDSGVSGGIKAALDARVHEKIGLAFNIGYQGGKKVNIRNIEYQNLLLLGAGARGILSRGLGVFGEINAKGALGKLFSDRDLNPAEFMAGASWDIKETGVTLSAGGGSCITCGSGGAKVRGVILAKYRFNPEKFQEMDSAEEEKYAARFTKGLSTGELKTLKIECPRNPDDFKSGVDDPSCPKFYELREAAELVLRCPTKSEDFKPGIHDSACPKVFNLAGTYSPEEIMNIYTLSVAEMAMLCPDDPAKFNSQVNDIGCPKYYDLKEMASLAKKCPASAEGYREGVDDASCPKFFSLKETYTAEQFSEFTLAVAEEVLTYGPIEPEIKGGEIQTLKPVHFDFNSARIRPADTGTLDRVVAVINDTPSVRRVRVEGHADSLGSAVANKSVSLKRAKAVASYMKTRGIRADVAVWPAAYGDSRPAATNKTASGRAQNRRVVFVVAGSPLSEE